MEKSMFMLASFVFLTACGGGSSEGGDNPPTLSLNTLCLYNSSKYDIEEPDKFNGDKVEINGENFAVEIKKGDTWCQSDLPDGSYSVIIELNVSALENFEDSGLYKASTTKDLSGGIKFTLIFNIDTCSQRVGDICLPDF